MTVRITLINRFKSLSTLISSRHKFSPTNCASRSIATLGLADFRIDECESFRDDTDVVMVC